MSIAGGTYKWQECCNPLSTRDTNLPQLARTIPNQGILYLHERRNLRCRNQVRIRAEATPTAAETEREAAERAATEEQARLAKLAILPDAIVTTPHQNENNDQEKTTLS